jgi:hypothetical protein
MGSQAPLATSGTKPGDISEIDDEWRIALVGLVRHGPDDYETVIRWYLPKTRADILAVSKARGSTTAG